MDPFFGNHSWHQHPDSRYAYSHSPSYRAFPVHRVDPWETCLPVLPLHHPAERTPAQKFVRIPVQFVGSKKVDRSGCALKIQKVYRGFFVRKCLKKIKDIKAKVDEIEERLLNGDAVELIRKDEKERLRMNETLMALLIQLDSVSGSEFGVRQCRKSVIRKAISLQEKIDAIVASNHINRNGVAADQEAEILNVANSNEPVDMENPENCVENSEITENTNCAKGNKVMEGEGNDGEGEIVNVGVDDEVRVGEENCDGDVNQNGDSISYRGENENENVKKDEGSGLEDNKRNRELLERMMEENEKMMSMMRQLFEKNEGQTRMLNVLTQRVEALEKAFACERLRKKKKKNGPPVPRRED